MVIVSASYGNDSCAMIQWCYESEIEDVIVVFSDTGWAGDNWLERVSKLEKWVELLGYSAIRIKPEIGFEELCISKSGFPNQRYQWCTAHLKGIPYLKWLDEADPYRESFTLVGKRRDESEERKDTPSSMISEYHGDRMLLHPIYKHSDEDRNALLERAGIELLPHRSHECNPCVNAGRVDFLTLTSKEIQRVEVLEGAVGNTMFRPKRHNGAKGIRQVVDWAKYGAGKYDPDQDDIFGDAGCGSPFGCGL